jgi:hypothetical protein
MRSLIVVIGLVFCEASTITAQEQTGTVRIQVRAAERPVEGAKVVVAGTTHRTDESGTVTLTATLRTVEVSIVKTGFAPRLSRAAGAPHCWVVVTGRRRPT